MDRDLALKLAAYLTSIKNSVTALATNTTPTAADSRSVPEAAPDTRSIPEAAQDEEPEAPAEEQETPEEEPEPATKTTTRKK